MASKAAIVNNEERSSMGNLTGNVASSWTKFTHFLGDVRSEMRKVVTPSRNEVQTTTTVVIVTVFVFGLFFWLTDLIFSTGVQQILHRLGGE